MAVQAPVRVAGIGAESISDFLDRQSHAVLNRLYERPASCLAIFRLLPTLARQWVMQLLFTAGRTSEKAWRTRLTDEGVHQEPHARKRLEALHLVRSQRGELLLNQSFQQGLKQALIGGGSHRSFGVLAPTPARHPVDVTFLDQYAQGRWEDILHFLVGSQEHTRPRQDVLVLLDMSGLMAKSDGSRGSLHITARGFQFLLEDVHTQLWDVLLQYLSLADGRRMDVVDVMSFLFLLGSLELGADYATGDLSPTQKVMLGDFADYGLVYQHPDERDRFWPTRLATSLTSHNANPTSAIHGQEREEKGYIILETNYRIYAYTSNPLRIAVLNLFISLKSRFPNLVMGAITRDSVKSALRNGITAEQIIAYLSHHAHPQMWTRDPLLPVTVTDQIRLWEREKNRIASEEGRLYEGFASFADYELVRDHGLQQGVLVFHNDEQRLLFVTGAGHEVMRDFIARRSVYT